MKLIKKKRKKSNNSNGFMGKILGICGGMVSFITTLLPILIMLIIMVIVVLISGVAGALGGKQAQDEGGGDVPNAGEVVILQSGAASPSSTAYIAYGVGEYGWFTGGNDHTGMDFQLTNKDEPTVAPYDGEVVSVVNYCVEGQSVCPSTTIPFWTQWGGNFVVIRTPHPEDNTKDMFIGYFHLRQGHIYVKPGDKVTKGQVIALPGNTGNSDGIHHHVTLNIVKKGTPFSSAGSSTLVDPIMIFCGVPGTEKHSACKI